MPELRWSIFLLSILFICGVGFRSEESRSEIILGGAVINATKKDSLTTDVNANGLVNPGDTLTYFITITNAGSTSAPACFEDIPDIGKGNLVPGSVNTSQGTVTIGNTPGDETVKVDTGPIDSGEVVLINFRVWVVVPFPVGKLEIVNRGFVITSGVYSPTDDPDTPAPWDSTVTLVDHPASLVATKTASLAVDHDGDGKMGPEDILEYTLKVFNIGGENATEVYIADTIMNGVQMVPGSIMTSMGFVTHGNYPGDTTLEIETDTLPPRLDTIIAVFQVTTLPEVPPTFTEVSNQGYISYSGQPDVLTDDPSLPGLEDSTVVEFVQSVLFSASKTSKQLLDNNGNGYIDGGDIIEYEVIIVGIAGSTARDIHFSDIPDPNSSLIPGSVTATQGVITIGNDSTDTQIEAELGDLSTGDSIRLNYQVILPDPLPQGLKVIANQGIITGDNFYMKRTDDPASSMSFDPTITYVGSPMAREETHISVVNLKFTPNPFRERGILQFFLQESSKVTVELKDISGRKLFLFPENQFKAGAHRLSLDTGILSRGIYLLQITAGDKTQVLRLLYD